MTEIINQRTTIFVETPLALLGVLKTLKGEKAP